MSVSTAPLGEIAEINPRFDRDAFKGLTELASFVPMAWVSEESGAITQEEFRPVSELLRGFTPFDDRDVLVAKITPCFENGKIAHARISKRTGFGSTEFHVLRPHAARLNDRYLFHFLRLPRIRVQGEMRMTGSGGQRRVPKAFLEELLVPLPALPEQRRIAAILDKADALRAKRRDAIAKLDQLLQSVFLEMFGDPNFEGGGEGLVNFLDMFVDVSAGHAKTKQEQYLPAGRWPIVDQGQALVGGYTDDDAAKSPVPQPVIIFGDHTRCVKYVDFPFGVGADGVKVLRPKQGDEPMFLYCWLKYRDVPSAGYSRHFKFLKEARMRRPTAALQRQFSVIAQVIEQRKRALQHSADQLDILFATLQHRAFTGTL